MCECVCVCSHTCTPLSHSTASISTIEAAKTELDTTLQTMTQRALDSEKAEAALKQALEKAESQNVEALARLAASTRENDETAARVAMLQMQTETLRAECDFAQDNLRERDAQLAAAQQSAATLMLQLHTVTEASRAAVESSRAAADTEAEMMREQLDNALAQVTRLAAEIDAEKTRANSAERAVSDFKASFAQQAAAMQTLRDDLARAQSEAAEAAEEIAALHERLAGLQEENAGLLLTRQRLEDDVKKLGEQLEEETRIHTAQVC
jgi:chromosome segregation ATPase